MLHGAAWPALLACLSSLHLTTVQYSTFVADSGRTRLEPQGEARREQRHASQLRAPLSFSRRWCISICASTEGQADPVCFFFLSSNSARPSLRSRFGRECCLLQKHGDTPTRTHLHSAPQLCCTLHCTVSAHSAATQNRYIRKHTARERQRSPIQRRPADRLTDRQTHTDTDTPEQPAAQPCPALPNQPGSQPAQSNRLLLAALLFGTDRDCLPVLPVCLVHSLIPSTFGCAFLHLGLITLSSPSQSLLLSSHLTSLSHTHTLTHTLSPLPTPREASLEQSTCTGHPIFPAFSCLAYFNSAGLANIRSPVQLLQHRPALPPSPLTPIIPSSNSAL